MIQTLKKHLERRIVARYSQRTIRWLYNHEADFHITLAEREPVPWQVKPLAELMFLLTVLNRHGVTNSSLKTLSVAAARQGSGFDWHELAAYDPSAATGMALVADFYQCFGWPVPFDARFFRALNDVGYFDGMDRLPYRDMDLAYNLERAVSTAYKEKIPIWFQRTAFGRRQHVVRYTIDDIYSLTHAVFYLADVGMRDPNVLLDAPTAARLRAELPMLTAGLIRADNTDVLGELLLCWIFCRVELTPVNQVVFTHALHRMIAAVTEEGGVAPTARILARAAAGGATFGHLYHTTLVGALLFALLSETGLYAIN